MNAKGGIKPGIAEAACLIAAAVLVLYVRIRLVGLPLDRDEGGWAYAGSLILEGIPPYKEFYDLKMPGVYYIYSLILLVFGKTAIAVKSGLLAVNFVSALLLFAIAEKKWGQLSAAAGTAIFFIFTLTIRTEGISANTEHFAYMFFLGSFLCAVYAENNGRKALIALSGALAGAAFLCKQPAILYSLFTAVYLAAYTGSDKRGKALNLVFFFAGLVVPCFAVMLSFILAGTFDKFLFMTVEYASLYGARVPLLLGLEQLAKNGIPVAAAFLPVIVFLAAGIAAGKKDRWMPLLLIAVSFGVTAAGLVFRPHYFLFMAPAAGIAAAYAYNSALGAGLSAVRRAAPFALALCLVYYAAADHRFLFKDSVRDIMKGFYGPNPFIESVEIGKYLKENSQKDSRIAVLGSEPQVLFYAGRRSATGYLYGLDIVNSVLAARMQDEAIKEIENAKPEFIVFVNISLSWLLNRNSEMRIFHWFDSYSRKYYEKTGVVDIISPSETVYVWGGGAASYTPVSGYYVEIYRRR